MCTCCCLLCDRPRLATWRVNWWVASSREVPITSWRKDIRNSDIVRVVIFCWCVIWRCLPFVYCSICAQWQDWPSRHPIYPPSSNLSVHSDRTEHAGILFISRLPFYFMHSDRTEHAGIHFIIRRRVYYLHCHRRNEGCRLDGHVAGHYHDTWPDRARLHGHVSRICWRGDGNIWESEEGQSTQLWQVRTVIQ